MELTGKTLQQKPGDPGIRARRDNLHESRDDGLRGGPDVHARGYSVALQAQKLPRPMLALGLLGAGVAVAAGMAARGRR